MELTSARPRQPSSDVALYRLRSHHRISDIASLGYSITAVRTETTSARTMALYACARSVARLARRENRSIADIVEPALESYEVREAGREPAAAFYSRLAAQVGTDLDLESVIREDRRPHRGIDL